MKNTDPFETKIPFEGMSLRDWFAGMALCGMRSNGWFDNDCESDLAEMAYRTADAMLQARSYDKDEES